MCGDGFKMSNKILVTDGENRNTLSVLRTIGHNEENYLVDVTSIYRKALTLCSYSKYCQNIYSTKTEHKDLQQYAEKLIEIVKTREYAALIPVGFESYIAVSKYAREFAKYTGIAVPDWEQMQIAFNKEKTMKFAENLGIPQPKTRYLVTENDVAKVDDKYPIVIKSSDGFLRYCNSKAQLIENFRFIRKKTRMGIISQEYIKGFGCGFYGVYERGKLLTHILQKRLKEFPLTGGPSVIAESFFSDRLLKYGKKLCNALNWHGPIMAEFKYDCEKDDYKLIEINPKLWGSLDLTIAAGINIPIILIDIARGKKPKVPEGYKQIKYKWVFPDGCWALASDFSKNNLAQLLTRGPNIQTNFSLDDIKPSVIQIMRALVTSPAVFLNCNRRLPHGKAIET